MFTSAFLPDFLRFSNNLLILLNFQPKMRTFFLVSFLVLSLFVVGFYAEEEEEKTVETQTQQPVEKLRSKLDSVSSPSDEEIAKVCYFKY